MVVVPTGPGGAQVQEGGRGIKEDLSRSLLRHKEANTITYRKREGDSCERGFQILRGPQKG